MFLIESILRILPTATPKIIEGHRGRGKWEKGGKWELFDEMMHDAHIQSVFRSRRAGVAGRVWDVVAADSSSKSHKIAEFIRKTLSAVPNFEYVLAHLLKAIPYGHSVAEIMWRIDGDAIRVDAVRTRRPERFILAANDEISLVDADTGQSEELPRRKFICHRHDPQDDAPFANPLLLSLYWPWYFKKHAQQFWAVFTKQFGIPPTIGRYPAHFTDADICKLVAAVINLQKVELQQIQVGEKGSFFRELLDFMNAEISKTVLGGTLTQEIGSAGSYAAARTHQEVSQEIIESDARLLQTTVNATLVRWLVDFNYGPQIQAPRFVVDCLPSRGTAEFAQTLKTLSEMGYKVPEQFISETFELPEDNFDGK
jgi:phage gp29-like protein